MATSFSVETARYFQSMGFADIQKSIDCGTNFLTALGLVCFTEYVGSMVNDNVGLKGNSKLNFETAFYAMGSKYKTFDGRLRDTFGMGFYEMFRSGLVHEYFIKKVSVVAKSSKGGPGVGVNPSGLPGMANEEYFRDLKALFEAKVMAEGSV